MRKRNVTAGYKSLTDGATTINVTIEASEATIERIMMMLLLADIPLKHQKEKRPPVLLPYETEEPAEFETLPLTRDELQTKAGEVITSLTKQWITAMDCVKALLASFGEPRISALSDAQLPVFVKALDSLPMDPAKIPAFIAAVHAAESLV